MARTRVLDVGDFSKELWRYLMSATQMKLEYLKSFLSQAYPQNKKNREAITGDKALKWAKETEYLIESLTDLLQTRREDVASKVEI